jgi:hypothetical protein
MNEGEPDYLRSRAKRYRQLARSMEQGSTSESLDEIAQGFEEQAATASPSPDRADDQHRRAPSPEPGDRSGGQAAEHSGR